MASIKRVSQEPYLWDIESVDLAKVANHEKFMPNDFISNDGLHITDECREYLLPLIEGEDFLPFKKGLPDYVRLKKMLVTKKLPLFS